MNTRLFTNTPKTELDIAFDQFAERLLKKTALIKKLEVAKIKHDPEALIEIAEDKTGKVIFLERGNEAAGYKHLLKHLGDYKDKKVTPAVLPKFIMSTLLENQVVGQQGKRSGRPIYRSTFFAGKNDSSFMDMAITVGSNGFIVGANPKSNPLTKTKRKP